MVTASGHVAVTAHLTLDRMYCRYPFAGLLSGYHHGYDWCNATDNTTIYDMDPFGTRSSGSFIKMVRLLMGDAIGYFGCVRACCCCCGCCC